MLTRRKQRLAIAAAVVALLVMAVFIYQVSWQVEGSVLPEPVVPTVDGFVPAVYDIDVVLDPQSGTVTGRSRVEYTNNQSISLPELYFHLYPNAAVFSQDVARPGRLEVTAVTVANRPLSYRVDGTLLKVELNADLLPQEQVVLNLNWQLTVPDYAGRLGENDGIISLGNWYPVLAVYDATGWNLDPYYDWGDPFYSEVGRYRVKLTLPDKYRVAATGNLRLRRRLPGRQKELVWDTSLVRDFALVISSDFRALEQQVDKTMVRSVFPRSDKAGGQRALVAGAEAVNFFNKTFGPYPYDQLTLAATGFYYGGMEYPNIVFLARQFYGPTDVDLLDYITVHETAHQWWYGVVGNNQITEAWLDEGLTEFSTVLFFEKVRRGGHDEARSLINLYQAYKQANGDGEILRPLNEFPSDLAYNALVYGKGCLLFLELREVIGEELLLEVLQTYYKRFAYKVATSDDFIQVATEVSGRDLVPFFQKWLH
ncbi:MAG: M1 family metallopeptidase [bacterium]